jgi:hypothetical protein
VAAVVVTEMMMIISDADNNKHQHNLDDTDMIPSALVRE